MKYIKNNVHIGSAGHSPREFRDVVHSAMSTPLPVSFDADYSKVPVQMQRKIGICTAEAVCTLIERFRNDGIVLSRRFTYLVGKKLVDGDLIEGSSIKSMLHGAYKYGTQPESLVPTDTTTSYDDFINFDITPYLATAKKIPGYINVPVDYTSLANGIYKYNGLACRFDLGQEWYTDIYGNITWDAKSILPLRAPRKIIVGHAIVETGYDFSTFQKGTIRNSWSIEWGSLGDGYSDFSTYSPTEAWGILPSTPTIVDDLYLPFTVNMHHGQTSNDVNRLQRKLKSLGYFTLDTTTNYYGTETQKSVLEFQLEHGLVRFGIESLFGYFCGPKTRDVLNSL